MIKPSVRLISASISSPALTCSWYNDGDKPARASQRARGNLCLFFSVFLVPNEHNSSSSTALYYILLLLHQITSLEKRVHPLSAIITYRTSTYPRILFVSAWPPFQRLCCARKRHTVAEDALTEQHSRRRRACTREGGVLGSYAVIAVPLRARRTSFPREQEGERNIACFPSQEREAEAKAEAAATPPPR